MSTWPNYSAPPTATSILMAYWTRSPLNFVLPNLASAGPEPVLPFSSYMDKSEFEIIRDFFAGPGLCFPREGVLVGNGDDGAVLRPPGNKSIVISTDVLNAGRHFPEGADPAAVAWRSLAVNLSDLAAMAAEPWCFTLGLTLPGYDKDWLTAFSAGLEKLAREFKCPLVGGDLNKGPLSIAIQVQGLIEGDPLLRSGARIGDKVYVSGCLGDAAAALLCLGLPSHLGTEFQLSQSGLTQAHQEFLRERYFYPRPQIHLARSLRPLLSSAIDLSDGLVGDLGHILAASEVGARLWADQLPVSSALSDVLSESNRLRAALFGGDDYELCFTAAAQHHEQIIQTATDIGAAVCVVGEIVAAAGLHISGADEVKHSMNQTAYRHF
ncbi:MAG: thiamine-phosphate kinase [Gammaproteobacteria bacterium]